MTKYINEETLRKLMYEEAFEKDSDMQKWDSGCWIRYKLFENCLEAVPEADVAPMRHGSWHRYSKGSGSLNGVIILSDAFQCTICKKSFWSKSDYCPNCGAKMDGGKDDV